MYSPMTGSAYGRQIRKSLIIFSGFPLMEQVSITPVVAVQYRSVFPASSTAHTAVAVPCKDLFPQRLELVRFDILLVLLIQGFFLFSLFSLLLFLGGVPLLLNVLNASQVIENQNLFIFILKKRMNRNNRLKPNEYQVQTGILFFHFTTSTGTSTFFSTVLIFSVYCISFFCS